MLVTNWDRHCRVTAITGGVALPAEPCHHCSTPAEPCHHCSTPREPCHHGHARWVQECKMHGGHSACTHPGWSQRLRSPRSQRLHSPRVPRAGEGRTKACCSALSCSIRVLSPRMAPPAEQGACITTHRKWHVTSSCGHAHAHVTSSCGHGHAPCISTQCAHGPHGCHEYFGRQQRRRCL